MTAPVPTLIADVDTGIDDMLALMYLASLHRRGEIHLAAVTTTAGNATVCHTANNSRWVLSLCGCPDVPVVAGAPKPLVVPLTTTPETHGETGLGFARAPQMAGRAACAATTEDVRQTWEKVLDQTDGPVRLVVTGPLTNLAHHRDLIPRFASVTVMGGAVNYPGNTTEHAEWNFWVDPDAVRVVLEEYAQLAPRGVPPLTLCHLGVTETIIVNPTSIERWAIPGELGQLVQDALRFYFGFHTTVGLPYCAQVHDLFAVMVACGRVKYSSHLGLLAAVTEDRGAVVELQSGGVGTDGTSPGTPAATPATPDHSAAAVVRIVDAVDPDLVRAEHERAFAFLR